MGGGLLQLVAYGAQDAYLTGNPQITFFIAVYRRHTNFAIESIQQTFNGTPGYGQRVTCTIARNGDLINRVYLALDLSNSAAGDNFCKFYGLRLLNYVEVEIGGQKIDKHYSHWMYIWNELSLPKSKKQGYYEMVGAYGGTATAGSGDTMNKYLYVPLEFWFCRNVGLALPLISLQYHEVKININFENSTKCQGSGTALSSTNTFGASLWVDYVFLDTDERRRFAQLSHEYLIEQLQYNGSEALQTQDVKAKLTFNHPCKELFWFVTDHSGATADQNNNWFNYTTNANSSTKLVLGDKSVDAIAKKLKPSAIDSSFNHVNNAKLILNGNDRFSQRNGSYFNLVQPYQHHENIPMNAGLNVYSFALKPEEHQPSGTLNMSRIDTAVLQLNMVKTSSDLTTGTYNLNVYAVNYNVLRIMSGMGGIAYSN
jgi:hypothetical protein